MNDDIRDDKDKKEEVILGSEQSEATPESNEDAGQASMTDANEVVQEVAQLKNLSQQFENNYKRALADYQNLQRRTQEEKVEWIRMAGKDLVLKFLPVLDTLILAQNHLQDKGIALSVDQFMKVLSEEGVEKIETIGKEFDPITMEVVTTKEGEKKAAGKVVEETRAGFMYYDSVLRPAQVVVGA